VLTGADLPSGGDPYEFRDPYIWRTEDGEYRSLIANANRNESKATQLCLYSSIDGFEWKFDKILFEDSRHVGLMWECPNFFSIDDRQILIASPMDMEVEDADGSIRFPKGNNVCYMVGDYDEKEEVFTPHQSAAQEKSEKDPVASYHPVDCGLDFYAPQVMTAPDGRRIMTGWMQDPSMANLHDDKDYRIFCQMTVPRELTLRNDRLIQQPVRELESYWSGRVRLASIETGPDERSIEEIYGRTLDMEIELRPAEQETEQESGECSYSSFSMKFAADEEHCCELIYDPQRSILTIDRSRSGQSDEITKRRSIRVRRRSGSLDLRILLDRWSAEIFINGGEQVMSVTYHTPVEAETISFKSEGKALLDISSHKIAADA
jgi:beta-fructofuranosidase